MDPYDGPPHPGELDVELEPQAERDEEPDVPDSRKIALAVGALIGVLLLAVAGIVLVLSGPPPPTADGSPSPATSPGGESPSPVASSPGAGPSPTATNPRLPSACPLPAEGAPFGAMIPARLLEIADVELDSLDAPLLATDPSGCVHVLLNHPRSGNLIYLTNRSGPWARQRLPEPPDGECNRVESDVAGGLAVDEDGSVWIAFTRHCAGRRPSTDGAFYVTDLTGNWSEPVRLTQAGARALDLEVRNRQLHLAYADDAGLHYATNPGGSWTDALVSGRSTSAADLELGADGQPRILFLDNAVRFARVTGPAAFDLERVATFDEAWWPRLVLDADDREHALWGADWRRSTGISTQYSRRGRSWSQPLDPFGADVQALGFAIDGQGALHALAGEEDEGLLHVTDVAGHLESQRAFLAWYAWYGPGAVERDGAGRLHALFFGRHAQQGNGLWHTAGVPVLARLANPLELTLSVDGAGPVDERGWAIVSGSLSCSRPVAEVQLYIYIDQPAASGSASSAVQNCSTQAAAWRVEVGSQFHPTGFGNGPATVNALARVCDLFHEIESCAMAELDATVVLTALTVSTPSPTVTPAWTPSPTPELVQPLPMAKPQLVYLGRREVGSGGDLLILYDMAVTNWRDYPSLLFAVAPSLPQCGPGVPATRTWVEIRDAATDSMVYAHCFMSDPTELETELAIARRPGDPVPALVYLELHDRLTGLRVRSDSVALPPPEPE